MTADDPLANPLTAVGVALFAEVMRDRGVCLNADECLPLWMVETALSALPGGAPRWLVGSGYTGDPHGVAAALLAHPRYLRLKERSEREVGRCDHPDTCRHGLVRRALLQVEREYFAALEDA